MKRTLSLLAALLITVSSAGTVSAGTITTPTTGNTNVSYVVASKFTVTIPDSTTLSPGDTNMELSAAEVIVAEGKKLSVKITGATNYDADDNKFRLKATDTYLDYTIKVDNVEKKKGDEVLAVAAGTATGSATLKFTPAAAEKAGTYVDQLTFTVAEISAT